MLLNLEEFCSFLIEFLLSSTFTDKNNIRAVEVQYENDEGRLNLKHSEGISDKVLFSSK